MKIAPVCSASQRPLALTAVQRLASASLGRVVCPLCGRPVKLQAVPGTTVQVIPTHRAGR